MQIHEFTGGRGVSMCARVYIPREFCEFVNFAFSLGISRLKTFHGAKKSA